MDDTDITPARRILRDSGSYTLVGAGGEQFVCTRVGGEWQLTRADIDTHRMQPFPTLRSAAEFVGVWYGRGEHTASEHDG